MRSLWSIGTNHLFAVDLPPPRLQHPEHLSKGFLLVRCKTKGSVGDHNVEGGIGQRHLFHVSGNKLIRYMLRNE